MLKPFSFFFKMTVVMDDIIPRTVPKSGNLCQFLIRKTKRFKFTYNISNILKASNAVKCAYIYDANVGKKLVID